MILEKIAERTKERILEEQSKLPFSALRRLAEQWENRRPFAFEAALCGPELSLICEVKKASPSKGLIAKEFPYLDIARSYETGGADAISVLTEPHFFQGKDAYLQEIRQAVGVALLRKDFTLEEYQIYQAALLGADAILLICSLLDDAQLLEYRLIAESLGMCALVETHDEREMERALLSGALIVGVNNRDLRTFTVDITNCLRLKKMVPQDRIFVAESGIGSPSDIALLREHKVDAALIGETLMRSADAAAAVRTLLGEKQ
jgi:indole-3-glycerol phosphate synthase